MAYHDDLRNPRSHPATGTPLGYETRAPGGSGSVGLVLGAVVVVLIIAAFAFSGGGDSSEPGSRPHVAAEAVPAPATGDAAPALPGIQPDAATPAPLAPLE